MPCAVNAALPQVLGDATSTAMTRLLDCDWPSSMLWEHESACATCSNAQKPNPTHGQPEGQEGSATRANSWRTSSTSTRQLGLEAVVLKFFAGFSGDAGARTKRLHPVRQCDARSASQSSRLNCPASCNLGKLLVTSMENFDDELLPRILGQLLSGPAAVKSLRSCRSLKAKLWPRCLQAGEGLWIAEQLKMVSLEELLARDENLYACFMWARGSTNISKMLYNSLDHVLEIHRSVPEREPSKERETDMDQHKSKLLVARSLAESFMAIDGNETLELTRRRLGFPNAMSQQLPELFSGVLETVGEESPALLALGLAGWKVSEAEQISGDHRWRRFCFQRPRSKIPLAILHLSGEFDLPGMDGNVKASLAYLSLDFDYVVALRELCWDIPIYRKLSTKVSSGWEDLPRLLNGPGKSDPLQLLSWEGTKPEEILSQVTLPDGWEVEGTTSYIYMDHCRCIMGSPSLEPVWKDARRLMEQLRAGESAAVRRPEI